MPLRKRWRAELESLGEVLKWGRGILWLPEIYLLGFVRPKGDVRFGLIERIEFPFVVADFHIEAVFRNLQADNDLMLPSVIIPVFDGIAHDFLNGDVGGENDAFGCVIALANCVDASILLVDAITKSPRGFCKYIDACARRQPAPLASSGLGR